jgi:gliding-associated putative ABC transporter substrate-binding component GldG
MSLRRTLLTHVWLQLALWFAVVLVANHLSSVAFFRADVTQDQRYTLSQVSRDAVARLDRPLVVRVFYSNDLGPPYNNHKVALLEKLEELRAYSGGRIEIEVADPDRSKDDAEEAQRYGIRPVPYRFRQGSRFEARDVTLGVVLLYGERTMPVDGLAAVETFEYQLVKGIRALVIGAEGRKVVGYTVGNGEIDLLKYPSDNPVGQLVRDMAGAYDLRAVTLGSNEEIPDDIDVLLVNGPEQPMSPRAQYQLDQFIMSGKRVAFFLRGSRPDFRTMRAINVRHDLFSLLGHYGVKVNRDAIIDREHNEQFPVPVTTERGMTKVNVDYPLIPRTQQLERAHPVTAGLDRAVLPFASSVELADPMPTGLSGTVLVSTEDNAGRIEGLLYVSPDAFKVQAPGEVVGSAPVVVAVTGRFGSFFADKPIPPPSGTSPDDPSWRPDPASKIVDSAPTRIFVAGSADMLANNQALVLNAIDWMVEDTALLEIRTGLAATDGFEAPEGTTLLLTRLAIFGGPLAVLYLFGGLVFVLSRRRS